MFTAIEVGAHWDKAVVFDMDGVLIEAKDWHYEALNRASRLFSLEISRHDHFLASIARLYQRYEAPGDASHSRS